jgi:hypothetical protein
LTFDQRRHLAVTCEAFEPVVLGIARQTNVQNHFRSTLRAFNPQGVLRNAIRFRFRSRHQISQENWTAVLDDRNSTRARSALLFGIEQLIGAGVLTIPECAGLDGDMDWH